MSTYSDPAVEASPWISTREAARRARCSTKLIYRAIGAGKLRASKLMTRREYRFRAEWVDEWIESSTVIVNPDAPAKLARLRH